MFFDEGVICQLIKLLKVNETGQELGVMLVNTDQIVAISAGQNATELHMADGHTRWVKETVDEVAAAADAAARLTIQNPYILFQTLQSAPYLHFRRDSALDVGASRYIEEATPATCV